MLPLPFNLPVGDKSRCEIFKSIKTCFRNAVNLMDHDVDPFAEYIYLQIKMRQTPNCNNLKTSNYIYLKQTKQNNQTQRPILKEIQPCKSKSKAGLIDTIPFPPNNKNQIINKNRNKNKNKNKNKNQIKQQCKHYKTH